MMGLIYLLSTYCVPGILESTQGKGHPKSCLLGPRPALTGLARAALGDPSSKREGFPDHCYRQWHRIPSGGLRADSMRGYVRELACVLPACWSALSCGPCRVPRVCSGSAECGATWGGGGRGCWNQDFRLCTPGLHFLC